MSEPTAFELQSAEVLKKLSDIDLNILRLNKQLDELPHKGQILELRLKIKELEGKQAQVQKMASDVARTLTLLDDETKHNLHEMAQSQKALDQSSEYRQTTALASELEMLANRKAKLEEDSLIQMEKQEKIAEVAAQVTEATRKLGAEEQACTDAYKQAGGKLKQEIFDLGQTRETLVARLPAPLGEEYLKALENKAGIGAAHLEGNRCSGCYATLTEGQLAKLIEGTLIGHCPMCNRLVVTT